MGIAACCTGVPTVSRGAGSCSGASERQADGDDRPLSGPLAFGDDGPAVHLDQPAHEREADAEPAGAAIERLVEAREQIEHLRQQVRRDARRRCRSPGCTTCAPSRRTPSVDAAARFGELRGVVRMFATTCARRAASPSTGSGSSGMATVKRVPPRLERRPAGLDGLGDDVTRTSRISRRRPISPRVMRDTSTRSSMSRHEVLDLPLNHRHRLAALRRRHVRQADELRGEPNRRQRIAELVRQHRQELVLAPAGLLQLGRPLGDARFEIAVQALELRASCGAARRRPRPSRAGSPARPAPGRSPRRRTRSPSAGRAR